MARIPTLSVHEVNAEDVARIRLQHVEVLEDGVATWFSALHLPGVDIFFEGRGEENARNRDAFLAACSNLYHELMVGAE